MAKFAKLSTLFTDTVPPKNSAPEGAGPAYLLQIYPTSGAGGLIALHNHRFVIGREPHCDLELDDASVSREHASIEPKDGRYAVCDLESLNGTYVNNDRFGDKVLAAGDFIRIGKHVLKFLASDHVETQYHEAVYGMMITDGLTGTYNKRHFLETFENELVRSRRHGRPLALAIIDIDHFKNINDEHGHLVGDDLLRAFCDRVRSLVRKDEVFARYGGDEFVMILDATTAAEARRFGERVRRAIANKPFDVRKLELSVTVSIGISHADAKTDTTVDEMIASADRQLYKAKHSGRNLVQCDP